MTSKELAALLGVSPSAVSIALNGKDGIGEETRRTILEAAKKHGLAKAPKRAGAPRYISLVIYKKHGLVYGDTPFFSAVTEGIGRRCAALGYDLQVSYFYAGQDAAEQTRLLSRSGCAGILLLATEMDLADARQFVRVKKPLVVLDSYFETLALDSVVINNVQGAYLATRHLIEAGHTRIGHLASSTPINNFQERHEGFLKAINQSPDTQECIYNTVQVASTQEGAYRDMCAWLQAGRSLPTAFFADNDIIALACMRALAEHGWQVPRDVSIIGFDDMPLASMASPQLTTVHVPKEELGEEAVDRLHARLAGAGRPRCDAGRATAKTAVNTRLVLRGSVAAPR